jgi:hypothetical protein
MHAGVFDFVQKKDCVHTLPGGGAAGRTRTAGCCARTAASTRTSWRINEALERRVEEQTALLEQKMRRRRRWRPRPRWPR